MKPNAIVNCEPCQARKGAALSGSYNVPLVYFV